jgi:FKBP-type peptidyl-prolyl cis-trans isomerase
MRSAKILTAWLLAASLVSGYAYAQTSSQDPAPTRRTSKAKPKKESATEIELRELREQMKAQQDEIDALKQQLSTKQQQLSDTQQTATSAQQQAAAAAASAQQASDAAAQSSSQTQALQSTVTDLKTTNAGLQQTVLDNQASQAALKTEIENPVALRYKGVTITPGGFFAFEGVWRQHTVNSDINTPLNSIPFPSVNQFPASELNFSGRQSRLSALIEAHPSTTALTGYAEMDFLGTGTSSNNNQSNSYVLRQRQIWGRAAFQGGFAVTGGQMWSLVTENRRGTNARTEIQPQTIDPQYLVGYSWTRQPGIRLQQHVGRDEQHGETFALSLEQAQITNFTANGTNPNQYFFGGLGQNGGLYNAAASSAGATTTTTTCSTPSTTTPTTTCVTSVTATTSNITTYANNTAPDLVAKVAFDAPAVHVEIGGLARWFRNYYYPVTWGGTASAPTFSYVQTYQQHTAAGGGLFFSIRGYASKYAELALQAMGGPGVGRYGSAQLADVTLRPDQTLEPIRNYHGLLSIETHEGKHLDIFAYYGGEYAQRTVYTTPVGGLVGYGPPNLNNGGCNNAPAPPSTTIGNAGFGGNLSATTCGSPTRYIQEPMFGFQWRPISDPRYGRLQYSVTYSYLKRGLWSGVGSTTTPAAPQVSDPMVHFQMRYYVP